MKLSVPRKPAAGVYENVPSSACSVRLPWLGPETCETAVASPASASAQATAPFSVEPPATDAEPSEQTGAWFATVCVRFSWIVTTRASRFRLTRSGRPSPSRSATVSLPPPESLANDCAGPKAPWPLPGRISIVPVSPSPMSATTATSRLPSPSKSATATSLGWPWAGSVGTTSGAAIERIPGEIGCDGATWKTSKP